MSRLLIITRPYLVKGFQLAGVEAYPARDVETAQELLGKWLDSGETCLVAIDDGLLENMDSTFFKRMSSSDSLLYLSIPGGRKPGLEIHRQHRIAEMIRRAIGFHITFKREESEPERK